MGIFNNLRLTRIKRRYLIQRDEHGRTARRRCFEHFDKGLRPSQVAKLETMKFQTVCRYFADWKKMPKNLEDKYRLLKTLRKNNTGFSDNTIEALAEYLKLPEDEIILRLQKPWGLKQILMHKWPYPKQDDGVISEAEVRLKAAITLINIVESSELTPKEILNRLLKMQKEHI